MADEEFDVDDEPEGDEEELDVDDLDEELDDDILDDDADAVDEEDEDGAVDAGSSAGPGAPAVGSSNIASRSSSAMSGIGVPSAA